MWTVVVSLLLLQQVAEPNAKLRGPVPLDPTWKARQTTRYHRLLAGENSSAQHLNDAPDIHLVYMRDTGVPVYYATTTLNAAKSIRTNEVWPGGSAGLNLDGASTTIQLAMWDGGNVRDTHEALTGRIFNQQASTGDCHHPTMVAGILAAAPGFHPDVQGMSYQSNVIVWDLINDDAEMIFAAGAGILLSNHSYEIPGGWRRVSGVWYWFGDITIDPNEDYGFGFYGDKARAWDQIAYDFPNYFIQKGCGNDRNEGMPTGGETHQHWDPVLGWVTATDSHGADGGDTGFDSISWFGNAKNTVAVGAVEDIPAGYSSPSDVVTTVFSSYGPCDDGRIKPDLVANGLDVTSTDCVSDTEYFTGSGTSYAGPTVTGSANLLRQLYESRYGVTPRAATLKAVILHTTDEAGPADGPDYQHGWGLMNTAAAAARIAPGNASIREETLAAGTTDRYWLSVPAPTDLKLTIVWTDPPGTPPAPGVDPPDRALVNDLDLRVTYLGTSTTYLPWTLDPNMPTLPAAAGDNVVDNVERIDVANAPAGFYEVTVSHKGALALGPQDYTIIAPGESMDSPTAIRDAPAVTTIRAAPNPTRGITDISFTVAEVGMVRVRVVDLRGRHVRDLVHQSLAPGITQVTWSGKNDQGQSVAAGIYLVLLETESQRRAVKISLTP